MASKKEFGKLSQKQLKGFYASYHKFKQDQEELQREAAKKTEKLNELVDKTGSWGKFYEFSYIQIIALFLLASGLDKEIVKASKAKDPQQETLELMEEDWKPEGLTEEEEAIVLGLFFAHLGNINGVAMFSQPVSDLVKKVENGEEEALFQAVYTDRSAVHAEPVARRICQAQIISDESFMDKLSKAIKRTKPSRPKRELDDVRYMLEVLDESCGLESLTHKKLYDLIVEDLELYPDDGKDPMSGLKKLIQKRNRMSGN